MSLTYIWEINNMKRNSSDGGIFLINYTIWALDAEEKRQHGVSGYVNLTPDSTSSSFVDFQSLTKATAINWVQQIVGKTEKEQELKQLWIKMFPGASEETSTVSQGMPWGR